MSFVFAALAPIVLLGIAVLGPAEEDGSADPRPIRLSCERTADIVTVKVVAVTDRPIDAAYRLTASGGGNSINQAGRSTLDARRPSTLVVSTIHDSGASPITAILVVELPDRREYRDALPVGCRRGQ